MTGVTTELRRRRYDNARPSPHVTKAERAKAFRTMANSLHRYADDPDCAASALECLDRADRLDRLSRCGWYPHRPRTWRP